MNDEFMAKWIGLIWVSSLLGFIAFVTLTAQYGPWPTAGLEAVIHTGAGIGARYGY